MKKTIVSVALVVASLIYVFSKNSVDNVAQFVVTNTPTNTAPAVPATPNPVSLPQATTQQPTKVSSTVTKTQSVSPPPPTPQKRIVASGYTDGTYTGSVADAYYGNVQVEVTIQNGAITDVTFLQYPNDRSTSRYINGQATPILAQEVIKAQSASVDGVSGASDTSQAFIQSLSSALSQAKA